MLLFGLHLILQNITAMFLYNCTFPVLRSLCFSAGNSFFFFPSFQENKIIIKKSSLKGILNKASAPVISGVRGASPRFEDVPLPATRACWYAGDAEALPGLFNLFMTLLSLAIQTSDAKVWQF